MNEECKAAELKTNLKGQRKNHTSNQDIQLALLNILYEQGLLTDKVHSVAVNKITKGV